MAQRNLEPNHQSWGWWVTPLPTELQSPLFLYCCDFLFRDFVILKKERAFPPQSQKHCYVKISFYIVVLKFDFAGTKGPKPKHEEKPISSYKTTLCVDRAENIA